MAQLGAVRARTMKRLQKGEEDVVLVVSQSEFESGRSGKREFWHNGILYDIKSVRNAGDLLRVTACADRHEQVILQGIQQLFQQAPGAPSGNNPLGKLLAQLLTAPFMQTDLAWILKSPGVKRSAICFGIKQFPGSRQPDIYAPPPETV